VSPPGALTTKKYYSLLKRMYKKFEKICILLSSYLLSLIFSDLSLKFTLNVRKKKSLRKNSKVRATGGLRKRWELGVIRLKF